MCAFEPWLAARISLILSGPLWEIRIIAMATTRSTDFPERDRLKMALEPGLTASLSHRQTGSPGKCRCLFQSDSKGQRGQLQKSYLGQSDLELASACVWLDIPLKSVPGESHLPTSEPKPCRQARLGSFFSGGLILPPLPKSANCACARARFAQK
jgi:hypothetical protein